MQAFIVKYTVQERTAYVAGFIEAFAKYDAANKCLSETTAELKNKGWKEVSGQSGTFTHPTTHRRMCLYIETLIITES